uniref:Cyclic AMP-dependent transcription factor ATF-7 n=1 Tax=Callorhinchus milii TaxID=7868 RepID=A0A4W3HKM2_CALMI
MGDDRPFVCNAPGCGQRFTNEDHLAVHKHKHEMTLKFGPARDGVIVADQTPTPTRFLKNCEEVGLFNELANPFEQEFKKADEDDSKKVRNRGARGHSTRQASALVHNITADLSNRPPVNSSGPPSPSPQLVQSEAKLVRFQSILLKCNCGVCFEDSPSQPTPSLAGRRRRLTEEDPDERRRRFLERNRAAASRCRQKRKVWVLSLEKKAEELTHMNVQLQNEVTILRNEVAQLKQLLLAHKDCPVTTLQKKTHEYISNPKESSEATGSPAPVIQHSSHGVATNGLSSRAAAEAVATSVLTQMANQRTELNLPLHPHVIMSTQSQSAGR